MKNFGSIMAVAALCASLVSARALPVGDGIMVRVPDLDLHGKIIIYICVLSNNLRSSETAGTSSGKRL